ncbi:MAG: NAD(P)-binding protein, partial [Bdellovibrionota bacterium]
MKNSGIYFLVTTLFFSGCAGQREKTETALRQGNFTVLFPPVALEELPQPPSSAGKLDVWVTDSQAKRKIQFGTIDSRHETFKALFSVYFPAQYLTEARARIRSLSLLIMEKMWREVRENREWSTYLTLLSNLKLFEDKMARPLIFEYLRRRKGSDEGEDNKIWEDLEKQMAPYLKGIHERKILPALFNMYPSARRQFLDTLQLAPVSFLSQMCLKARARINRALYEEHFGPLLSNRISDSDQDFFLEHEEEDPNQGYEQPVGGVATPAADSTPQNSAILQSSQKLRSKCHLTFNEKSNTLDGQIDVVIVGAGSTGSYMAYLLWRAGYKVLLVDKGPLPTHFSPMGKRYALWNLDFVNSKNFLEEGKLLLMRPELVGGGDTLGTQVSWPITDAEMIHFIQSKREAGSFPPLFYDEEKLSEMQTSVAVSSGIRVMPDEELSSREKLFRETALNYGLDVRALRSGFGDASSDGRLIRSPYIKPNLPLD